jgi:uncharacterized membrane protein YbjE (DUF340 family)
VPEPTTAAPSSPPNKGWWWQLMHERDGWASLTKVQRFIGFILVSCIIGWSAFKGQVATGLTELILVYLSYIVGARFASQIAWQKENKDGNSSGSTASSELAKE